MSKWDGESTEDLDDDSGMGIKEHREWNMFLLIHPFNLNLKPSILLSLPI